MYIVMVRKKTFSQSAQRMIETDRFYIYESKETAIRVAKALSNDAGIVFASVAEVSERFEGRANG